MHAALGRRQLSLSEKVVQRCAHRTGHPLHRRQLRHTAIQRSRRGWQRGHAGTCTYSSWLNQVERFFALITDKAIQRGSFTSVKQLVQRIDYFVAMHNTNCQPFKWTATADSILESCIDFAHVSAGQDTRCCH